MKYQNSFLALSANETDSLDVGGSDKKNGGKREQDMEGEKNQVKGNRDCQPKAFHSSYSYSSLGFSTRSVWICASVLFVAESSFPKWIYRLNEPLEKKTNAHGQKQTKNLC